MCNSIMEQMFGAYDKTIKIIVHNYGKQAEIDLDVNFSEGNYACALLIHQFTSYVMRLAEISTYPKELTDEYIAKMFMDKTLSYRNTKGKFNMPRSEYGDDQYYGLSIHLDISNMLAEFNEERLNTVVHWAWNHVGFPSLQTQFQMSFDKAIENGIIGLTDDSDKGWKTRMAIPSDKYLEIAGTLEYFSGDWPNSECDTYYSHNKDLQAIKENWNKNIGDVTYYAMYEPIAFNP